MKYPKKPWFFILFLIWGHLRTSLITLGSLLFCAIMILFKQLKYSSFDHDFWTIHFKTIEGSWLHSKFEGKWAGFSMGSVLVFSYLYIDSEKIIRHEQQHTLQVYLLGIMQPIFYFFVSVFIFFFKKDLHSYYDNIFEVDARSQAGQLTKIDWKSIDKNDRWIFW